VIALLVRRMLLDRPRRTAILLLGFGIAVGVMITLLSIGSAILEQARDKDLVGGGDVVLLPEGVDVEVLKIGGATGMFYTVDQAPSVFRQMLSGPRFAPRLASVAAPVWPGEPPAPPLAAASPVLANKVLYLRKAGSAAAPRRVVATGLVPSLDRAVSNVNMAWEDSPADRLWMEPPVDSLYHQLDRFHRPPAGTRDADRWAEWLYFNFADPKTGRDVFLSYIVAGVGDSIRAQPLLQITRGALPPARFAGAIPLHPGDVAYDRLDLRFGSGTHARFEHGAWRLALDYDTPAGHVRAAFIVEPVRDLLQPPFLIQESDRFVSGYVVPAIRARANGWIEAGGERLVLQDVPAYHDHNWGTWRDVHWDWGTAATWDYGLFYGRVLHPELRPGRAGAGLFVVLAAARTAGTRGGFLALFRPSDIYYEWKDAPPALPGSPDRIPRSLTMRSDSLAITAQVDDVLASQAGGALDAGVLLQGRARFDVASRAGGRPVQFTARGFAETFVRGRTARP